MQGDEPNTTRQENAWMSYLQKLMPAALQLCSVEVDIPPHLIAVVTDEP